MEPEPSGFISSLFDFSFSEIITIRLLKLIYGLMLALIGLGTLISLGGAVMTMIRISFISGIMSIVVIGVGTFLAIISARVWMEILIVIFRIADNTAELVKLGKRMARPKRPAGPRSSGSPRKAQAARKG